VLSIINGKATGDTSLVLYTNVGASTLKYISTLKASPPVLAWYVTLDNKIKCLSLAFFFGNLTSKTVTGTAYTWDY
jgi:hypothetical protein